MIVFGFCYNRVLRTGCLYVAVFGSTQFLVTLARPDYVVGAMTLFSQCNTFLCMALKREYLIQYSNYAQQKCYKFKDFEVHGPCYFGKLVHYSTYLRKLFNLVKN